MNRKNLAGLTDGEVPTQIKNPDLVRERRRQIIDSTVKLFIRKGYHKTTTRMIARAADISIGSLYEYVSSKEDLLYLVCKTVHEEVRDAVEGALSNTSGERAQLAEVIRRYFKVCDRMADHILLMFQVSQFLPEKWKERILLNELNITDTLIQALAGMSENHSFSDPDGAELILLGHNISVLGQMWALGRRHIKKRYTIDRYIAIQTNFILEGRDRVSLLNKHHLRPGE